MNILFLEGDMSRRGGTERMTAWLSSALSVHHAVHIVSLHCKNDTIFYPLAVTVINKTLKKSSTIGNICDIHRYILKNHIDVVINVDTGMGYIGILATIGTKASVITWEHSNYYNNWDSRVFQYLRRFAAKHSDAMVVLTERDRQNYQSGIKKCVPVHVIPNPVAQMSNDISYNIVSKTILSAGVIGRIKRFDRILEIGRNVFVRHPDWNWIICGDGDERENLENAVRKAGLCNNIRLVGTVRNMDEYYNNAAVFVLTSDMEGLPMVLLEAKAHRLPIVSFDINTGPSDIVRDGVNGYLVSPYDTDVMADRLCELIENDTLRQRFSDNTVLDMEKFNGERIAETWENLTGSL